MNKNLKNHYRVYPENTEVKQSRYCKNQTNKLQGVKNYITKCNDILSGKQIKR